MLMFLRYRMVLHLGDVRVRAETPSETEQSSQHAKASKKPGKKGQSVFDLHVWPIKLPWPNFIELLLKAEKVAKRNQILPTKIR